MQPIKMGHANEWFARADRDLQVIEHILDAEPSLDDAVVFHAQQAAEKALKGFLTACDISFPKTHELEGRVAKCMAIDSRFERWMVAASILTPYAAEFRYPGPRMEPPGNEAREAFMYASDILQFVRGVLADAEAGLTPPTQ